VRIKIYTLRWELTETVSRYNAETWFSDSPVNAVFPYLRKLKFSQALTPAIQLNLYEFFIKIFLERRERERDRCLSQHRNRIHDKCYLLLRLKLKWSIAKQERFIPLSPFFLLLRKRRKRLNIAYTARVTLHKTYHINFCNLFSHPRCSLPRSVHECTLKTS